MKKNLKFKGVEHNKKAWNDYYSKTFRQIRYGGCVTGDEEEKAIIKSIKESRKTRNWQAGKEAALFEKELCEYLNVKHTILTTSGSCAGLLTLSALELPKGSEVIISAVTFPTIFNIILQCGLIPVVVDAKVGTYNFDIDEVEKAITPKTSAVIAIHALGNPVDLPRLKKVCGKKIKLILDNCDGLGTTLNGKKVETYADIAFTSFHAAHIVSMGVGGGVFTNDAKLAEYVRVYRDWGRQANTNLPNKYPNLPKDQNPRFIYEKIGYNFQILDLQAAMGRVQLRQIKKIKEARKKNFDYLWERLVKYHGTFLELPRWIDNADVCWFAFPITCYPEISRAELTAYLEKNGIETRSMFSGNIIKHPAFENSRYRVGSELTWANYILEHSFWISCHNSLTKQDLDYIIKIFNDFFKQN